MRHSRFRYWLWDTIARVKIPGVQKAVLRSREFVQIDTLGSLIDPDVRRGLVQHMSSASSCVPGSIGERRKLFRDLEAMVDQVEAETADLGMNGGAGRIPSGFCTMSCAVFKWEQLFETVLKSYPSGSSEDASCRDFFLLSGKWNLQVS